MKATAGSLSRCALLIACIGIPIVAHSVSVKFDNANLTAASSARETTRLTLLKTIKIDPAFGLSPFALDQPLDILHANVFPVTHDDAFTKSALTTFGETYSGPLVSANGTTPTHAGVAAFEFGNGISGPGSSMTAGDNFKKRAPASSVRMAMRTKKGTGPGLDPFSHNGVSGGGPGLGSNPVPDSTQNGGVSGSGAVGAISVPDSGASLFLLEIALGALGLVRRVRLAS